MIEQLITTHTACRQARTVEPPLNTAISLDLSSSLHARGQLVGRGGSFFARSRRSREIDFLHLCRCVARASISLAVFGKRVNRLMRARSTRFLKFSCPLKRSVSSHRWDNTNFTGGVASASKQIRHEFGKIQWFARERQN
jgi:hypothetical protein